MRVAATQYNVQGKVFEIYVSGCSFHCKGCHNEELWDFNVGEELNDNYLASLVKKIKESRIMIKEISILGGEPLLQDDSFFLLVYALRKKFPKFKYTLFTGFNLDEINLNVFPYFDRIKYGRYIEELRTEGEYLASSNQGWWIKEDNEIY